MSCPVRAAAERHPSAPALFWEDRRWTWAEVDREVSTREATLRAEGLQSGARCVIQRPNEPEVVWTFFACGRIGATFVPLNARLTEAERARLPLEPSIEAGEAPLAALFTSGTTGVPKRVELTRANFEAAAAANAQRLGGHSSQRWLGTLPLFHIGGLAMLYRCAVYGASLVLQPGFDAARAVRALDEGVTHASFVPTTLQRLLDHRGAAPFRGVEAVLIGGGPMTEQTLRRAREHGLPVLQTYGLTEACSQVTTEVPGEADGTSAGPPLPGIEVRIANPDGSGVGEIEVRGATIAKGLGPWLQTRDLGMLDARGRLRIMARRTDLIVTGGENVYPAEVEAVLREHPSISDVAVVPRADQEWGQIAVAFVVTSESDDQSLTQWAKQRLAGFKVPKQWVRVTELPRTATGKIERHTLVARLS